MATDPSASSTSTAASQYAYSGAAPYFPLTFHLQNPDPSASAPAATYLPPQIPPPVKMHVVTQPFAPTYPTVAPICASTSVYSLPQYQQAQQLFQRDAQTITITPEALESVKAVLASTSSEFWV